MTQQVLKKVGHSWVLVVFKDGSVVDWRPATASEILAMHNK